MRAFIAALIITGAFGVGAGLILTQAQEPAHEAFATSGARVGDPGHNLVGPD